MEAGIFRIQMRTRIISDGSGNSEDGSRMQISETDLRLDGFGAERDGNWISIRKGADESGVYADGLRRDQGMPGLVQSMEKTKRQKKERSRGKTGRTGNVVTEGRFGEESGPPKVRRNLKVPVRKRKKVRPPLRIRRGLKVPVRRREEGPGPSEGTDRPKRHLTERRGSVKNPVTAHKRTLTAPHG